MPIDRDHIVQVLRQRGDEDHARDAEQQPARTGGPGRARRRARALGLNPQNLLDDDAAGLEDKLDPDDIGSRPAYA